jgi:hypothetical protein
VLWPLKADIAAKFWRKSCSLAARWISIERAPLLVATAMRRL